MRAYKNISVCESNSTASKKVVCRKKLHLFSVVLVFILSFSCLGISFFGVLMGDEVRHITSSWAPNLAGLGKLKFVGSENDFSKEAMASVEDFSFPFTNSQVASLDDGSFFVNGLGGMVVKACYAGRVEKIERNGDKKTITLSHSNSLKTVYEGIDTLGVKERDAVEKNTPLGVCFDSFITFKIFYKNRLMGGLSVSEGQFSFI